MQKETEIDNLITQEKIKFIPQVKFEVADINSEAELFYDFIKEDESGRFIEIFTKRYPELVKQLEDVEDKEKGIIICKNFAEKLHQINEEEILLMKDAFQIEWKKIEVDFLSALAEHFETDWLEEKSGIVGKVTVLPVFPRHLDEYVFYVGYQNVPRMIETSAHEIVHFLWFKKWQEVFPDISKRERNSPYLAWRLSEIIDPIILQCQPRIKELIKPKGWGYSSFKEIKIGDLSMTDHYKKVYEESVSAGNDFTTTMKILWAETQKHEKEIGGF
jgi:hypothetical protein